jgi:hypothetical protein
VERFATDAPGNFVIVIIINGTTGCPPYFFGITERWLPHFPHPWLVREVTIAEEVGD